MIACVRSDTFFGTDRGWCMIKYILKYWYFAEGYTDRDRYSFTRLGIINMLYKICPKFLENKCFNVILAHSPIIPEQFKIFFRGGCNEFVI